MPPTEAQTTIRPPKSLAPIHPAPQSAYDIKSDKTAKSNGAAVSNANSPSSTGVTTSDVQAVSEFLSTMKMTLGALGATFDVLGDQTARIAALGPAISATHQIQQVSKQLEEQSKRQDDRMQEVKKMLTDEMKSQIRGHLTTRVDSMIAEIIQKEVAQRVRRQLTAKLPASLREEVEQYKRQITEVKISLHNSEARRYNALIRSTAFDEPLRPLLLPLMSPAPASGTTAVTSASPPSSSKTPIGASATPELTPLIPSPLFPLNLSSLISMEPSEARALVKEYGLIEPGTEATITDESQRQGKKASAKKKQDLITESSGASREDDLNRFMKFIGVEFQLLPMSPTRGSEPQLQSPLMTGPMYSFVN